MIIFQHVHIEQRRSEELFYTYTETTTNSVYRAYLYRRTSFLFNRRQRSLRHAALNGQIVLAHFPFYT